MCLNSDVVRSALEYQRLIKGRKLVPEELDPAELVFLLALFDVARDKIIYAHEERMVNTFDQEVDRCWNVLSSQTYGMSTGGFLEIEKVSCALLRNE